MSRVRAGVSLAEVLAVVVILTILAQIMQPVLLKSVMSAKRSRSEHRMKNLARAIEMYRTDYGDAGGITGMNLPLDSTWYEEYKIAYEEAVFTGGYPRGHGGGTMGPGMYIRMFPDAFEVEMVRKIEGDEAVVKMLAGWRKHVEATGGNPVLYMDDTFYPIEHRRGPYFTKYPFAVFTDTHIARKAVRGNYPYPETKLWEP